MDRVLAAVRAILASAAVLWAVLIVAAPSLGRSPSDPLALRVAAGTYLVGAAVCHQRPERSLHTDGARLPVCGRCTGLYLSGATGMLAGFAWVGALRRRRRQRPEIDWRPWLLAAAMPTALTLVLEWLGLWFPSNVVRAMAAAPAGASVGLLLSAGLSFRGRL